MTIEKKGSKPRFIISGGGTGGHIYPAIAIANELKRRFSDSEILFVGAKDKMEMEMVPKAGYPIEGLWISGLQRRLTFSNLVFPFKLLSSLWKSRKIVKSFKPDIVIGTGGFASGAVVKVAASMNIPTLVQEQNSYPGITNKLLGKKANRICVAYDNLETYFPSNKIVKTGNPVRQDLLDVDQRREEAIEKYNLDTSKHTLLVLGGSLGARKINELIVQYLPLFEKLDIQVIWQCGKHYYETYKKYDNRSVQVYAYIDRMDLVYAASDIIISRAGASSVSELAIVGKPVLFIPSPNVSEDHQTKNANSIVSQGGAIMIKESEIESFENIFTNLIEDKDLRLQLGLKIKELALPNATVSIVDEIVALMNR